MQATYPKKDYYLNYIKNSQNSTIRNTKNPIRKWAKWHRHFTPVEITPEAKTTIQAKDYNSLKEDQGNGHEQK